MIWCVCNCSPSESPLLKVFLPISSLVMKEEQESKKNNKKKKKAGGRRDTHTPTGESTTVSILLSTPERKQHGAGRRKLVEHEEIRLHSFSVDENIHNSNGSLIQYLRWLSDESELRTGENKQNRFQWEKEVLQKRICFRTFFNLHSYCVLCMLGLDIIAAPNAMNIVHGMDHVTMAMMQIVWIKLQAL